MSVIGFGSFSNITLPAPRGSASKLTQVFFILIFLTSLLGIPTTPAQAADVCTSISLDASEDTWLRRGSANLNYGGATTLEVNGGNNTQDRGALLRWNLSSIPSGATITAASLTLNVTNATANTYSLYDLKRNWVEGNNNGARGSGASWNYYGAAAGLWGTGGAQNTTSDRNNTNLWNATSIAAGSQTRALNSSGLAVVQSWVNTPSSNQGLTIQNYAASNDNLIFTSSEGTAKPKLNITYCVGTTKTITFQNGASGYSGTVDTYLRGTTDGDLNFSADTNLEWDDNTGTTTDELALIRFTGLFSNEGGPIPSGSLIQSATLTYMTTDLNSGSTAIGDPGNVYESLVDWTGNTATYNNFGGEPGVQTDERSASVIASAPATAMSTAFNIDVTASLQRWMAGTANYGWIILPTGTDGVVIYSSDIANTAYRPKLTVTYITNAPKDPVLVQPSHAATGISISPTLEVTVSDPNADMMDVSIYGRKVEDFSIVLLPDTQLYAASYPGIFSSQVQWIVDHRNSTNTVFVTGLGDIVSTAANTAEYDAADAAYDLLDAPKIPYSVGAGNHDVPLTNYNTYFGPARFTSKPWYGGHYGSTNENSYSLFSATGNDFILINLEYNPSTEVLDWADALLSTYSSRRAIVESHSIISTDNSWTNQGIYTALSDHANLFLMVCGHMHPATDGAGYLAQTGPLGNTIHIVEADYQDYPNGGSGYLRILRFSPADDQIHMTTYSPTLDIAIGTYPDQMDLGYDLDGGSPFELLGTQTGVTSGSNVSVVWNNLLNNTNYEWYAVASDGANSVTSPIWHFTTGSPTAANLNYFRAGKTTEGVQLPGRRSSNPPRWGSTSTAARCRANLSCSTTPSSPPKCRDSRKGPPTSTWIPPRCPACYTSTSSR